MPRYYPSYAPIPQEAYLRPYNSWPYNYYAFMQGMPQYEDYFPRPVPYYEPMNHMIGGPYDAYRFGQMPYSYLPVQYPAPTYMPAYEPVQYTPAYSPAQYAPAYPAQYGSGYQPQVQPTYQPVSQYPQSGYQQPAYQQSPYQAPAQPTYQPVQQYPQPPYQAPVQPTYQPVSQYPQSGYQQPAYQIPAQQNYQPVQQYPQPQPVYQAPVQQAYQPVQQYPQPQNQTVEPQVSFQMPQQTFRPQPAPVQPAPTSVQPEQPVVNKTEDEKPEPKETEAPKKEPSAPEPEPLSFNSVFAPVADTIKETPVQDEYRPEPTVSEPAAVKHEQTVTVHEPESASRFQDFLSELTGVPEIAESPAESEIDRIADGLETAVAQKDTVSETAEPQEFWEEPIPEPKEVKYLDDLSDFDSIMEDAAAVLGGGFEYNEPVDETAPVISETEELDLAELYEGLDEEKPEPELPEVSPEEDARYMMQFNASLPKQDDFDIVRDPDAQVYHRPDDFELAELEDKSNAPVFHKDDYQEETEEIEVLPDQLAFDQDVFNKLGPASEYVSEILAELQSEPEWAGTEPEEIKEPETEPELDGTAGTEEIREEEAPEEGFLFENTEDNDVVKGFETQELIISQVTGQYLKGKNPDDIPAEPTFGELNIQPVPESDMFTDLPGLENETPFLIKPLDDEITEAEDWEEPSEELTEEPEEEPETQTQSDKTESLAEAEAVDEEIEEEPLETEVVGTDEVEIVAKTLEDLDISDEEEPEIVRIADGLDVAVAMKDFTNAYSDNNVLPYENGYCFKINKAISDYNIQYGNAEPRPLFDRMTFNIPKASCTVVVSDEPEASYELVRYLGTGRGATEENTFEDDGWPSKIVYIDNTDDVIPEMTVTDFLALSSGNEGNREKCTMLLGELGLSDIADLLMADVDEGRKVLLLMLIAQMDPEVDAVVVNFKDLEPNIEDINRYARICGLLSKHHVTVVLNNCSEELSAEIANYIVAIKSGLCVFSGNYIQFTDKFCKKIMSFTVDDEAVVLQVSAFFVDMRFEKTKNRVTVYGDAGNTDEITQLLEVLQDLGVDMDTVVMEPKSFTSALEGMLR